MNSPSFTFSYSLILGYERVTVPQKTELYIQLRRGRHPGEGAFQVFVEELRFLHNDMIVLEGRNFHGEYNDLPAVIKH